MTLPIMGFEDSNGDPQMRLAISGGNQMSFGLDDTDNDNIKLTDGANPSSGNEIISVDSTSSNAIKFNNAFTFPTADGGANEVLVTNGGGALSWAAQATAGNIIQVVSANTTALVTCNTALPIDDTIPQNTEGSEVLTVAITPGNVNNKLLILFTSGYAQGAAVNAAVALFQDSTINALAASRIFCSSAAQAPASQIVLSHYMTAGTTSSTTFKIRVGPNTGSGNVYINGAGAAREWGGVASTVLTVIEIQV